MDVDEEEDIFEDVDPEQEKKVEQCLSAIKAKHFQPFYIRLRHEFGRRGMKPPEEKDVWEAIQDLVDMTDRKEIFGGR